MEAKMELKLIQKIHKSTKRDYMGRMNNDKVACATVARKFDYNFWDGNRQYGYGGYYYDGRWESIAEKLVKKYNLTNKSRVLDIGCGKGFLAADIARICNAEVWGCDISSYAIFHSPLLKIFQFEAGKGKIRDEFDLIISINTLHNLMLPELKQAMGQINKSAKNAYIVVESYRTVQELHNLQCWNLTGEQFLRPAEWVFLFKEWNYRGDYEFIFFD